MKTTIHLSYLCIGICLSLIFVLSCNDADVNKAWGSKQAPQQISNIRVKNISGGAVIYYERPDDTNFYYLKATYHSDPGVERTVNASFYTDSVLLTGFGTAGEYEVDLYSISFGDIASEPVKVTINPTTPPYLLVAEKLKLSETFGGLRIQTENETGATLAIGVVKKK